MGNIRTLSELTSKNQDSSGFSGLGRHSDQLTTISDQISFEPLSNLDTINSDKKKTLQSNGLWQKKAKFNYCKFCKIATKKHLICDILILDTFKNW